MNRAAGGVGAPQGWAVAAPAAYGFPQFASGGRPEAAVRRWWRALAEAPVPDEARSRADPRRARSDGRCCYCCCCSCSRWCGIAYLAALAGIYMYCGHLQTVVNSDQLNIWWWQLGIQLRYTWHLSIELYNTAVNASGRMKMRGRYFTELNR